MEVVSDGRVLQRVVANLLDNAIKYSEPDAEVEVGLTLVNEEAVLTIRDHGMGIAADELALIFDRFYRTDRSRTRPGNDLGLSFCRAALNGLGGEISCESEPDRGSTFTVTLPIEGGGWDTSA